MKLRHLILLTSAIGASGALLLAADMYRRLKEAEAANVLGGAVRDDSVLAFGMYHTMGLLSLAFIFLALFLMLMTSVRDRQFVAAIETPGVMPLPHDSLNPAPAPMQTIETPVVSAVSTPVDAPAPSVPVEVVPVDAAPISEPASPAPPIAPVTPVAPVAPVEPIPTLHQPPADTSEKRVLAFEPPASEIAPPPSTSATPPSPHSAESAPPSDQPKP